MRLAEFKIAERGPRSFDYWYHPQTVGSPIGPFGVELQPDRGVPDEQMIIEAEKYLAYLAANGGRIAEKVFEHYQRIREHSEWLEQCGVPDDLSMSQLAPYLEVRSIVAGRRQTASGPHYDAVFFVSPKWDTEHKIVLEIQGEGVEFIE